MYPDKISNSKYLNLRLGLARVTSSRVRIPYLSYDRLAEWLKEPDSKIKKSDKNAYSNNLNIAINGY